MQDATQHPKDRLMNRATRITYGILITSGSALLAGLAVDASRVGLAIGFAIVGILGFALAVLSYLDA